MPVLLFQAALAVALFLLVNWLGRHSAPFGYRTLSVYERVEEAPAFNLLFRVAVPQVFIIIVSALLSLAGLFTLADDIWLVTAMYFGVRITFNLLMGRAVLINWWTQIGLGAAATAISYWLSESVLTTPQRALPNSADLTTELWLVVILFIYHTLNRVSYSGEQQATRQEKYVTSHYEQFRARYQDTIASEVSNGWVEALVYAILIFEDFNRPAVARLIENYVLFPLGLATTLGPMQVVADRRISDLDGVRLGARRVAALYPETEAEILKANAEATGTTAPEHYARWLREAVARQVAVKYNPDGKYADEVRGLYEALLNRYYMALWKRGKDASAA